jgi:hypothetical protein
MKIINCILKKNINNWRGYRILAMLVIGLLLCSNLGTTGGVISALAQSGTSIAFSPNPATVSGCGTTRVEIWINDPVELYGADVRFSFNPAVLEVVDADPSTSGINLEVGDLLDPTYRFIVRNEADNVAGTVIFAGSQLRPAMPVNTSGVLAVITFRAKSSGSSVLDFTYTKLATRNGDPIAHTRTDGAVNTVPLAGSTLSISRLNATTARLTWNSISGAANYHLYRAVAPYFTPSDPAYVTTASLTYDDVGALGDIVVQYYYVLKAACPNGFKGSNSNRVGEYDFPLRNVSASNYSDVSMVFNMPAVTRASHLAAYVGSSVKQVKLYKSDTQSYLTHIVGFPLTDFDLSTGMFIFLVTDTTAPPSFALVGNVPDPGSVWFNLEGGSPTRFNYLSLPLDQGSLTMASSIVNDIGAAYVVRLEAYRIDTQSYQSYYPGFPVTDFPVVIGEPFVLRLRAGAPSIWP